MSTYANVNRYFLEDFPRTLFPLETNRILVEYASSDLAAIAAETRAKGGLFLPQVFAYAAKPQLHLRRTLKLDAPAEFFLYQLTYEHRAKFRDSDRENRKNFGYRFSGARMVSPAISYRAFRSAVRANSKKYAFCVKADIAQYFNTIYTDDLVGWWAECVEIKEEVDAFSRFLHDINSGRAIDCLPHGIFPAKVIGSQFLSFLERTVQLRAAETIRFMDDIYMFDDDVEVLSADFHVLQRLLGARGLAVNAGKTQFGRVEELNIEREVDRIKQQLLRRRGDIVLGSGADEDDWDDDNEDEESTLSTEEIEYLLDLLSHDNIEEEDAELILAVMRDHTEDVLEHVEPMLQRFPSLSKNVYHFCRFVDDQSALAGLIKDFLKHAPVVTEFQLFWLARICEDVLWDENGVGELLLALYQHGSATDVSRGKVLEIPEMRFGMADLREHVLKSGASNWTAWCSAVGARAMSRKVRNGVLKGFAAGSQLNSLIAKCVVGLPDPPKRGS